MSTLVSLTDEALLGVLSHVSTSIVVDEPASEASRQIRTSWW